MNKKKVIGVAAVVIIIVGMFAAYFAFKGDSAEGKKEIKIEVINSKMESKVYEVKTEAEFLRQAMEEAEGLEFEGEESQYGLVLQSVNGEKAVYEEDGAYWCIMVNGEYGNYGADQQPVADGDQYQLVYTMAE